MNAVLQDLRFALRQLRRSPGFALTAILTLALGIGANTAIFSLLDQALLRSLPVRAPQQIAVLEGTGKLWQGHSSSYGGDVEAYFSYPMYEDLRDRNQVFQGLIATTRADVGFVHAGSSELANAELVSGNYFSVLGVQPALGRLFTQAEDVQKDGNPVVVLSFDFWRTHLGADPHVVGEEVSLNGHVYQVIGVSAAGFRSAVWGETPGLFVPMSMLGQVVPGHEKRLTDHTDRWMNILARLKPGISRTQAETQIYPLWHALRAEELKALGKRSKRFSEDFLDRSRMRVLPGARGFSYNRDTYEKPLLAVTGMALLVLLIASVNVASLLLVRSASRVREFSLRYALGAGGGRILQQLLLEGLLIGAAGGLAGLALAPIVLRVLVQHLDGDDGIGAFTSGIDTRVLLFNFAIALVVSVLFSLAPTLQLRRPDLAFAMRQQSGTGTGAMLNFRRGFVSLQIGLSGLLLVGAGLFVRSMQKLHLVDAGFTTSHLATFGIDPKLAGYAAAAGPVLQERVLESLAKLPGVQTVTATTDPELAGHGRSGNVVVAGYTAPPDDDVSVEKAYTTPTYLSALEIPLLAGRFFTDGDTADHPAVAVVNETFAKHFCGSVRNCVGRQMNSGDRRDAKLDMQIVGIMRDVKHEGLRSDIVPTLFRPLKQDTSPNPEQLYFYLRTSLDPAAALPMIRRTMQQIDAGLALNSLKTMDAQIEDTLSNDRLVTLLAISFGLLATLMAGIGLYGVLAYTTAQRTREIGLRIALGSSRMAISRMVLMDVLKLAGIGVLAALPVAYLLGRLLRNQLFGVSPADPVTMIVVVLSIGLVALIAASIPAQRAASIDPTEALRTE